jgi:hypothetical protein
MANNDSDYVGMMTYELIGESFNLLDEYFSHDPYNHSGLRVVGNSNFIFVADSTEMPSADLVVFGEELHLCGDKIPKLYTTKAHLSDSIWNGTYNSCIWCNENFLVIGCGWNIATEAYDLGLTVFAINSNGSLTLKYQDVSLNQVKALCHDGNFLYVGSNYDGSNSKVRIYTIETDGTLTLKDTIEIDSVNQGQITGIKNDGRFIYISTNSGTPWET